MSYYCMTLREIKERSVVDGKFDPDVFADIFVDEIIKWGRPMVGMGNCDAEALREDLGMDV